MKRKAVITVITVVVLACLAGAAQAVYDEYLLYMDVYNADGSEGTNLTENSFGGLRAYRKGIAGQIAPSENNIFSPNCTQKIFDAVAGDSAYVLAEVGSANWATAAAVGDSIITVVQVYQQQFVLCPWNGNSYAGAVKSVVEDINTYTARSDMPPLRLQLIPAPQISAKGASDVTLTWTGIAYDPDDLVTGYTVYRSTEPGGAGGFGEIGAVDQVKGGTVTYNDTGLSGLYTYYYQLAVNFEWGGGGGAPSYYTTDARSAVSAAVYTVNSPTQTETASEVPTASVSPTETQSVTDTITMTPSYTATDTQTVTETVTETGTPSSTLTLTLTLTLTCTSTPTSSVTPTFTCTATPTSALAVNIGSEKLVILNSPIKNGRLQVGIYSDDAGKAVLYAYNVAGELVYKETLVVTAGANVFDREFKKARGLYMLRVVLKTPSEIKNMAVKKFAVIKNNY